VEIRRTTDISEVLRCLPFEREVRKKGRDILRESHTILIIQSQLENPMFGFWIAYDDEDNIKGYVVAALSLYPGMERCHIMRIYAKDKALFKQFEEILKAWGKEYHVKIASITVGKHVKAFQRLLGYVPVSVNMERRYF